MDTRRPIIAVNYYFNSDELGNRIFAQDCNTGKAQSMKAFRAYLERRGFDVVTLDSVSFDDPAVKYVLYFEYNWRMLRCDPFLKRIPFEKRALVLLEPANVNPSMYLTAVLRNMFNIVFTWDSNLLARHPRYTQINVPVGAEPRSYVTNRFADYSFAKKKFLVSVSTNRWGYMPQSTFRFRRKAYHFFEKRYPADFDLFGGGWNQPCVFYEKWLGCPIFKSWRGIIPGSWDEKVREIAKYKFSLCFENNASEPGYISEKIIDCFCARCVPVYFGSAGTEKRVPRGAWIDLRDFRDFSALATFLDHVDEARYNRYLAAIDQFMGSAGIDFFSTEHFYQAMASRFESLLGCAAEGEAAKS